MKTSRLISFTGSMAALTVMTVLSVLIGQVGRRWNRLVNPPPPPSHLSFDTYIRYPNPNKQVFHAIPQGLAGGFKFDQWVAVLAFSYFGLKTLKVRLPVVVVVVVVVVVGVVGVVGVVDRHGLLWGKRP
jgi:hypothetical protein